MHDRRARWLKAPPIVQQGSRGVHAAKTSTRLKTFDRAAQYLDRAHLDAVLFADRAIRVENTPRLRAIAGVYNDLNRSTAKISVRLDAAFLQRGQYRLHRPARCACNSHARNCQRVKADNLGRCEVLTFIARRLLR